MIQGFQVWADAWGNLHCADGTVLQARTAARFAVGSGADLGIGGGGSLAITPDYGLALTPFPSATGASFLGGNGRNLIVTGATFLGGNSLNLIATGLEQSLSGPVVPAGVFMACEPSVWRRGIFTIAVTGPSAATIHDGTDTVAILSAGGTAPVGSYVATTYGAETYNGEDTFTIAAAAEAGTPLAIPSAVSQVSAGNAPAGAWTAVDAANYELTADTDWTLAVAPDGSAEILYLSTAMAARDGGTAWSPDGIYAATAAGKTAYHSGADWTATVAVVPVAPRAGFVYLEIVESSGTVTAVNGPYFGSLPSNTADHFYFPLAESDGSGGLEQLHRGTLIWPSSGGGGGTTTGLEWVSLTMEDYDALDPKDPDTIYDLTDAPWES